MNTPCSAYPKTACNLCLHAEIKNVILIFNYKNEFIMKMKTVLLMLVLIPLLSGCERSKFCPGFPEKLRDYFPYKKGNILSFANEDGKI